MDPFPQPVDVARAEGRPSGHCWLFERVEGTPLRFALRSDGRLVADDSERSGSTDPVVPAARPAVEHVRANLDRDALRAGVDVDALTCYGIATCHDRLDYDFDRLPAFLGTDVRIDGELLSPDRAFRGFERIGLTPAPTTDRERRADTIKPDRFGFPASKWADAPVAGVLIADKHGWRGRLDNDAITDPERPDYDDAAAAAEALVTEQFVAGAGGDVVGWVRNELARRHRGDLRAAGIDPAGQAFRSAVAEQVGRVR